MNDKNEYFKTLHNVNIQRQKLKNQYTTKNLMEQGLFEQAAKLQAPTVEAITKSAQKITAPPIVSSAPITSAPFVTTPEAEAILNVIKTAPKTARDTNGTLKSLKDMGGIPVYTLGSNNRHVFGLIHTTLINATTREEHDIHSVGFAKLIFYHNPTDENITKEDIDEYKKFLGHYNFNIAQPNKRALAEKFLPRKPPQTPDQRVGEGLKTNTPLIIPENTDNLVNEFLLQIADTESGKNNTFNYTNALMKEMLKKKLITIKNYRNILRYWFKI
jgi:hypothetical protein